MGDRLGIRGAVDILLYSLDGSVWCFLALLLWRKSLAKRGQSNCNPARGKPLVDSGGLSN